MGAWTIRAPPVLRERLEGRFQPMRVMGLDVGTKTVGVALSDELGLTAQGLTTVRRTSLRADLKALETIIREHAVERAIIGLPLNMDGTEGPRAEASRRFGAALEQASHLPVEYWDERLSTVAAERVLLEANLSREKRKQVIDQVAAGIILQGWLDAWRARTGEDDDGDQA